VARAVKKAAEAGSARWATCSKERRPAGITLCCSLGRTGERLPGGLAAFHQGAKVGDRVGDECPGGRFQQVTGRCRHGVPPPADMRFPPGPGCGVPGLE
jgi:hypothetical protein